MTEPIRLAILGCGAITGSEHIPDVSAHPGVQLVALVDTDLPRGNAPIQNRGHSCKAAADYREVLGQVDAVLNVLPNHLHVSSNMDCLRAGGRIRRPPPCSSRHGTETKSPDAAHLQPLRPPRFSGGYLNANGGDKVSLQLIRHFLVATTPVTKILALRRQSGVT